MANGYIRLKIEKTTTYRGRVVVLGESIDTNVDEAKDFVGKGLATVENGSLEEPVEEDEFDKMTIEELREFAEEAGIDLKGLSKKADIISAIKEGM